jgi:RNA polymerase sigma-70 factor (ECF subfamily)
MIDAVWRAVGVLNPDLKMALLLRDIVGLSYSEIADSLEITLATVKWRIYKAREEVQEALAREGIGLRGDVTQRDEQSSSQP